MQKTEKQKVKIETEKIISKQIICNKCGKAVNIDIDEDGYDFNQEKFHQFDLSFGYGSSFNTERWQFDLCEYCILELIRSFKHVPDNFRTDYSYFSAHDFDSELHQELFEEWKETGVWNWEKDKYNPDEKESE